jgi:hypothetical protein
MSRWACTATAIAAAHHCGDHRTQQLHSSAIINTRGCCLLLRTALLLHSVVMHLIMPFNSQHLSQLRSAALHLAASVRAATALHWLAGSAGSWDSGCIRLPRSPQR